VGIGKFLIVGVKNILTKEVIYFWCMLASGLLPVTLRSYNELNIVVDRNGQIEELELNGT
jgi:hypothetical protein